MSRITSQVKSDVIRGGRKLNQQSVPSGSGVREGTHAQWFYVLWFYELLPMLLSEEWFYVLWFYVLLPCSSEEWFYVLWFYVLLPLLLSEEWFYVLWFYVLLLLLLSGDGSMCCGSTCSSLCSSLSGSMCCGSTCSSSCSSLRSGSMCCGSTCSSSCSSLRTPHDRSPDRHFCAASSSVFISAAGM
ncbi:unnamed protein product [Arctogadus glacialis]